MVRGRGDGESATKKKDGKKNRPPRQPHPSPTPTGRHRWVVYANLDWLTGQDPGKIPGEWHGWLHQITDETPATHPASEETCVARKPLPTSGMRLAGTAASLSAKSMSPAATSGAQSDGTGAGGGGGGGASAVQALLQAAPAEPQPARSTSGEHQQWPAKFSQSAAVPLQNVTSCAACGGEKQASSQAGSEATSVNCAMSL